MKRYLVAAVLCGALLVATGTPALAADGSQPVPGSTVALGHTTCAGHGSFGAFGREYNFGVGISNLGGAPSGPNGRGASGPATGSANANLCGRPQGTP
ncbi:MAG TPA: hypothetical protein VKV23_04650 [Acidimicrobiales bacterium]|jgi:hypothetical protein|nr:hypothetical protein [Acidimicrobiales bacterium]